INEWKRMEAMDISDVYYDKFLVNGEEETQLTAFKGGEKVRLRISNAGGSSYFWLTYAGGKMMVVANDGNDVEPVEVDRLIVGVSETYDVVVSIPKAGISYEILATPEDRSGVASLFVGQGIKQLAARLPRLIYFEGMKMMNDMMKMNGDMHDMGMNMRLQQMDMNAVMYPEISGQQTMDHTQHDMHSDDHSHHETVSSDIVTLNYGMLKSPHKTTLNPDAPVK